MAKFTYMTMSGFRCDVSGKLTWNDSLVPVVATGLAQTVPEPRITGGALPDDAHCRGQNWVGWRQSGNHHHGHVSNLVAVRSDEVAELPAEVLRV